MKECCIYSHTKSKKNGETCCTVFTHFVGTSKKDKYVCCIFSYSGDKKERKICAIYSHTVVETKRERKNASFTHIVKEEEENAVFTHIVEHKFWNYVFNSQSGDNYNKEKIFTHIVWPRR